MRMVKKINFIHILMHMLIRIITFVLIYLIWKVIIIDVNDYWICVMDGNHMLFPYSGLGYHPLGCLPVLLLRIFTAKSSLVAGSKQQSVSFSLFVSP